jgi:hypothetical protein
MRQSLFAGRRLRASYRNVPMDTILALLERSEDGDEDFNFYCLYRPRLRSHHMKEEEY